MDLGLTGRKAIVCASSKGLGKGCAMSLARGALEGARHPIGRHLVGSPPGNGLAGKEDAAAVGFVEPGQDVDQRCFAGPVRTDDAMYRTWMDLDRQVVQGNDATERFVHARNLDERFF